MHRTNDDFIALIKDRIERRKFDELFSGGCCFHFALRAFQKGIGSLAYTKGSLNPAKKGHVFVLTTDGLAFDHKGFRAIGVLKTEFCTWSNEPHFPVTEDEIKSDLAARPLPAGLEREIFAIADMMIDEKSRGKPDHR